MSSLQLITSETEYEQIAHEVQMAFDNSVFLELTPEETIKALENCFGFLKTNLTQF